MQKQREKEADVDKLYQHVLDSIIYPMVGKKTTYGNDLTKVGLKLFGMNYMGTFAADQVPDIGKGVSRNFDSKLSDRWIDSESITNKSPLYLIANLDTSDEPGSHWIAVAFDAGTKKIWVYDSFGRDTNKIIPFLAEKFGKNNLRMADDDSEQKIIEEDCGARSLAFLYIFDRYGVDVAKLI